MMNWRMRKISIACFFSTFGAQKDCHYSILGVQPTASVSEIKQKYYELAKLYHPDVCEDPQSSSKFTKITIVL